MTSEDNDRTGRIKSAASLLVKGGTLTSEACPKCSGVQVRYADKITCINCGNESKIGAATSVTTMTATAPNQAEQEKAPAHGSASLALVASIIEEKVAVIAAEIRSEGDISIQRQKADLLESYLRILERTKSLLGQ